MYAIPVLTPQTPKTIDEQFTKQLNSDLERIKYILASICIIDVLCIISTLLNYKPLYEIILTWFLFGFVIKSYISYKFPIKHKILIMLIHIVFMIVFIINYTK